ncbi:MAG: ComEC/Rec2 family competence protein, partial [Ferrovibrionaceae bacterium]
LPILAGCIAPWLTPGPDLLVDGEARLIAVRTNDGFMLSYRRAAGGMVAETWARRLAEDQWRDWPGPGGTSLDGQLRCEKDGCLWRHDGLKVALVRKAEALAEACAASDIVVSSEPVRGRCRSPRLVIDRVDVWRRGAHTIRFHDDGRFTVATVAGERGQRPWVRRRGRAG